jgi:hypothetical protein
MCKWNVQSMVSMQVSPGSQEAGTWTCPSVSMLTVRLIVATCIISVCFRDFRETNDNFSFVKNQLDAQFFFMYVYFNSLHVSGSQMLIIRRSNCINTNLVYVTLYRWPFGVQVQTCTPNGHLCRVTYTRCHIDTIASPDDEHVAARNM